MKSFFSKERIINIIILIVILICIFFVILNIVTYIKPQNITCEVCNVTFSEGDGEAHHVKHFDSCAPCYSSKQR